MTARGYTAAPAPDGLRCPDLQRRQGGAAAHVVNGTDESTVEGIAGEVVPATAAMWGPGGRFNRMSVLRAARSST